MEKQNQLSDILTKRAIDVTVEELATVIAFKLQGKDQPKEKRLLKGIPGIMEIFKCGRSKASELRKSGVIDAAIIEDGRVFLVDADKALELVASKRKGGRR